MTFITYLITAILIVSLFFIATERETGINKAAVAVFACTVGWVLYIGFGADYVSAFHAQDYAAFLAGETPDSTQVKYYIAQNIFIDYLGNAAEIVLFLLATMSIVNILYNNGCFDFLTLWIRTRNSRLLLWKLTAITFFLSVNLDNVSTIVLMLTVTNAILIRSHDRMIYGAMVTLAVIFGGAMSVIGDPTGLVLWNKGAITASDYTLTMAIPCFLAWVLPTLYFTIKLPVTVDVERPSMPFRGDDTNLKIWQRLIMLLVGIGGLWFIPTFHVITRLPPFLGALCVLSLLWIVNEIFNRKLFDADRRLRSYIPQRMQYNSIQQMLYVVGVLLAVGVVTETGAMAWFQQQLYALAGSGAQSPAYLWGTGIFTALISTVLDSFASCMTMVSLHDVTPNEAYYDVGGAYWKILSFGTAVGGSIFGIGSITGIVMMQMQGANLKWYFKNITPVTLISGIIAFAVLCAIV